jgi:hypothetical protein
VVGGRFRTGTSADRGFRADLGTLVGSYASVARMLDEAASLSRAPHLIRG